MHGVLTREEYDALVAEASRKLNAKYEEIQARPRLREAADKLPTASPAQLERIIQLLEEG